jgi:lysozyme family protein
MPKFDEIFSRVIHHEGGFTRDPKDRGNWTSGVIGKGECRGTKYGISAMSYPMVDIEGLTLEKAREIYKRDWWDKLSLDKFHSALAFQIFDSAVNHGMRATVKLLQKVAGTAIDGVIGPLTIRALNRIPREDVCILFVAERIRFYTQIATFSEYGRGWMNRVAQNLTYIAEDN